MGSIIVEAAWRSKANQNCIKVALHISKLYVNFLSVNKFKYPIQPKQMYC